MRRRKFVVAVVAAVMFIIPVAAVAATSLFTDVPDDNIFVEDINWMKSSGITQGCNPAGTEYCPEGYVTRQQMAAFMHRLAGSQAVDAGTLQGYTADQLTGGGTAYIREAILETPFYGEGFILEEEITLGAPSFVSVSGQAVFASTDTYGYDIFGCGITNGTDPTFAFVGSWRYPTVNSSENPYPTCATQTGLALLPGTHTIRLTVSGIQPTTYSDEANLLVTVLPLGTGTMGALDAGVHTKVSPSRLLDE